MNDLACLEMTIILIQCISFCDTDRLRDSLVRLGGVMKFVFDLLPPQELLLKVEHACVTHSSTLP